MYVLVPSAPPFFTLSEVEGVADMLMSAWSVPQPANGVLQNYTVTCSPSLPAPMVVPHNDSVSEYSVRLSGLMAFTNYSCSVMAATNAGTGNPSEVITARTAEAGKN